jgi:hypothetical protein
MPEYEAKQYEEKMKGGNILISVHTEDGAQHTRVKEIFKNADAVTAIEDLEDSADSSAPVPARISVSPAVQQVKDRTFPDPDPAV